MEVLKKASPEATGGGVRGSGDNLSSCLRPRPSSLRSETWWLFDFRRYMYTVKWCWWGALFFRAGRETQGAIFQHPFPQNVQRTVFFVFFFKKAYSSLSGVFLSLYLYLYHVILFFFFFSFLFFFLIAFIAGRSLFNEICTTLFQTTHVLLFGNI